MGGAGNFHRPSEGVPVKFALAAQPDIAGLTLAF
jgi:hypothetical protein